MMSGVKGQSDEPVTMSKSAESWGQLEAAEMIKSLLHVDVGFALNTSPRVLRS